MLAISKNLCELGVLCAFAFKLVALFAVLACLAPLR